MKSVDYIMLVDLFKCLTIPLCLIVIVHGEHAPSITYISQTQTQDVGGTLELVCAVEHAQEYPVLWVKYDKLDGTKSIPLSNNCTLITKDPRISLRFDPASAAYNLSIKDLQETDAGWYQCQIIRTGNSNITADVELQVPARSVNSDNSTLSLVVSEGENVQLECYTTGVPPPTVFWRREEDQIFSTAAIHKGNILKFPSIQKEHQGAYFCGADSQVFDEAHRLIEVHVQYAPIVTIPELHVVPTLGQSTYLTCHVGGYPPPAITWFKEEAPLKNDQHYRIANFATADDFTSSFVRMDEIEEAMYGNYTCKAQNELGIAEGQVEIIEPVTPVCVSPCDNETHIETTTAWRPWITTK